MNPIYMMFTEFYAMFKLFPARIFRGLDFNVCLQILQPKGLLKRYALRFVTSSFDQRGKSSASDKKQTPVQDQELEEISQAEGSNETRQNSSERKENGTGINDFVAYRIAASAASYLQSKTLGILPFNSAKSETSKDPTEESGENEEKGTIKSLKEMSFVATTNSVTAVVAGKEEMKDAVAKDLNSAKNSPCEWYICDDDSSSTRYFVIQVRFLFTSSNISFHVVI